MEAPQQQKTFLGELVSQYLSKGTLRPWSDAMTLRGCYENMDKYNLEKFEVKVYDCNEFLCNGASDGFGNVGLFFFLPLIIVYIF